jgi:hypothetical protein
MNNMVNDERRTRDAASASTASERLTQAPLDPAGAVKLQA